MWLWLGPAVAALFLYGVGQGLVKKWISEVHPARFCLYFVVAKSLVNLGYFLTSEHPPLDSSAGYPFLGLGVLAYVLDGLGWIFYFQSIIAGPIAIVGTLSAAYPALTVLFASFFLGEALTGVQYAGVGLVIAGCMGLSYSPESSGESRVSRVIHSRWIPLSFFALVLWAGAQTIVKYAYGFPEASEANLAVCNMVGGMMTLGVYGVWKGLSGKHSGLEWVKSFMPMGMMAGGDLGVIIANRFGPISIVTPITGAYPVVTLGFAWMLLKERISRLQLVCILAIFAGMVLATMIESGGA